MGDLPGVDPKNMAGESLTQMARRKNAEKMAARRRAESIRSVPPPSVPVEEAEREIVAVDSVVEQQSDDLGVEQKGEKRPAEIEAESSEEITNKRPQIEELSQDLLASFIIQPRMKNTPVSTDASAIKDPAVALSVASAIFLPMDKAVFRAELDVISIALVAQSAILVRNWEI